MTVKRRGEKSVLSRQEIATRRKALNQKKVTVNHSGRRAIFSVFLFALNVMALLAIASFDASDRVGPGFKNAVGPVGHALAEALRGLLGICAFVVPLVGLYAAGLVVIGDRQKRRWPQAIALSLLLVSGAVLCQLMFTEDASWAHAPGGLIGRELSFVLTALFSTVGTVVLVGAVAAVAFIVGTEFAFVKLVEWVWAKSQRVGEWLRVQTGAFLAKQKDAMAQRREAAQRSAEENAEFLAQLEAEEAELAELELAANEAEAAAAEVERGAKEKEYARLADLAEKERLKAEREKAIVEREAARLAREALKTARANQKETRRDAANTLAPALMAELQPPPPPPPSAPVALNGDPAWTAAFLTPKPSAPTLPPEFVQSLPPPRRVPNIVEAPQPAVVEALAEISPADDAPLPAAQGEEVTALARMPVIVEPKAPPKPTKKEPKEEFLFTDGRSAFEVPPLELLTARTSQRTQVEKTVYLATAEKLIAKLKDFSIEGEVVEIRPGPVITMYEFRPAAGVKIARIASLADDIAMALEAKSVRIVQLSEKGVVGVEVPNRSREMVFLKEIAEQDAFQKSASRLTMCIGKDTEGMPYILDLAKAPHLLIAGTTGSGKSVGVNTMIMSMLLKSTPEEVRFIMVDPKMLELSVYEGIPHLLLPVVTDSRKAAIALQWAVDEMERRYKLLSEAGVRNIAGYNTLVEEETKQRAASSRTIDVKPTVIKPVAPAVKEEAPLPVPVSQGEAPPKKKRRMLIVDVADPATEPVPVAQADAPSLEMGVAAPKEEVEDIREAVAEAAPEVIVNDAEVRVDPELAAEEEAPVVEAAEGTLPEAPAGEERKKLPYIVVIVDEFADLMMVAAKEVETSIARIAQKARAAGIHLMLATQRPSTDVVTGVIKANFPTRISFSLRSKPDSMTIIGTVGAEALLGNGDMLVMPPTSASLDRAHGCYVSEDEIKKVVDHLKAQGKPVYDESILKPRDEEGDGGMGEEDELHDELYDQAIAIVSEMRTVSISILQRKMRIGYNRSARMIERMERDGLVGPADGAKPREVLARPLGQMPGAGAMM